MNVDVTRGRNNQLWDLGLSPESMYEDQDVKDKIKQLDDEFDQVLILEKMDEGLIVMAEALCWSLHQVNLSKIDCVFDFVTHIIKHTMSKSSIITSPPRSY